jgi:two-component system, NarL family, sensor histidine kinase DesK
MSAAASQSRNTRGAPWRHAARSWASFGTAAALYGIWTGRKQLATYTALKKANQEIERLTRGAERDRISQDLHDVLGHELAMISLKAQLDEEWSSAIRLLEAAHIQCTVQCGTPDMSCHHPAFQVLAMCVREAATNIVRHSGATKALLRLEAIGQTVRLTVADDGRGLSATVHEEAYDRTGTTGNELHLGLAGMRAKVATVEGELRLWTGGRDTSGRELPAPASLPWISHSGVILQLIVRIEERARAGGEIA